MALKYPKRESQHRFSLERRGQEPPIRLILYDNWNNRQIVIKCLSEGEFEEKERIVINQISTGMIPRTGWEPRWDSKK